MLRLEVEEMRLTGETKAVIVVLMMMSGGMIESRRWRLTKGEPESE